MTSEKGVRFLNGRFGLPYSQLVEGDEAGAPYFAPTDPVVNGNRVLGGFSRTSMEHVYVSRSASDGALAMRLWLTRCGQS